MKKVDKIPAEVLDYIQTEHERALSKILMSDKAIAKIPVRPVQMCILRPQEHNALIETVIVPPVNIYVRKDGLIEGGQLSTRELRYVLPYTGKPFPFGHIYESSGYICLGSIFVPSVVSIYNPQQPIETLFLHNDRNTNHGNSKIIINKKILDNVMKHLDFFNIEVTDDVKMTLVTGQNILRNDALWILSAEVVKQAADIVVATDIMDRVFRIVFRVDENKKGE